MRILVANDDGIYSPGIAALAEVASKFGEVRVVAPDVERSSAGHSITAMRPLSYRRTPIGNFEAYRVDGTPADCVALGNLPLGKSRRGAFGDKSRQQFGQFHMAFGDFGCSQAGDASGLARHRLELDCHHR